MLKLKPEYLTKNGERQFVVLTMEDFARITEALEDAEDLCILRSAREKNKGKPTYTLQEIKAELGMAPSARKKTARS